MSVAGSGVYPDVFADVDADWDAVYIDDLTCSTRREIPQFIEDAVVGKLVLVVDGDYLAIYHDGRSVVDVVDAAVSIFVEIYDADHGGDTGASIHQVVQGAAIGADEVLRKQQIFWRVASDGEFRERDDIGSDASGFFYGVSDQTAVSGDISDGRVDLRRGDSNRTHLRVATS